MAKIAGKRVVSGSKGILCLNGLRYAEVKSVESKASINRDTVQMGGDYDEDSKITSISCEGSFVIHKVFTREKEFVEALQKGDDPRFQLFVDLDDPQSYGKETIQIDNCWFNEITLIQFEVGSILEREFPFGHTFSTANYLNSINPR